MPEHKVGTQEEFDAARKELLAEEKELTRRSDELARKRRELPWVPVEKDYSFETEAGTKSLAQLFDGRSQLLVIEPRRSSARAAFHAPMVAWRHRPGADTHARDVIRVRVSSRMLLAHEGPCRPPDLPGG